MATGGKVLGKLKDFNKEYGKPIRDARCRNACSYTMKKGVKANERLQETLKPFMLRRNKVDFLKDELPVKREICVWVKPSRQQALIYTKIVQSNFSLTQKVLSSDKAVAKEARMGAFQVIAELKKLCGHPSLLEKGDIRSALEQNKLNTIITDSRKLELAVHLLKGFREENHKVLVFSQSTQTLNIIQHVLLKRGGFTIARLDG